MYGHKISRHGGFVGSNAANSRNFGVDRDSIRMAIGQVTDYWRFVRDGTWCAVLLPSPQRQDLVDLLSLWGLKSTNYNGTPIIEAP
jgi:hypothetical protein